VTTFRVDQGFFLIFQDSNSPTFDPSCYDLKAITVKFWEHRSTDSDLVVPGEDCRKKKGVI
jgi:hypothetical protein